MIVVRKSMLSGVTRTMDIPVTEAQLALWESGMPIQRVMPHLTPDQREFLMTGISPEEWDEEFHEYA